MLSAGVPVGGVHFLLGESALGAKNGEKVQLEIAAQEAIAGGVRIFQLRDKTASTESLHTQMETLAHLLDKATRKTGETFTLMINDDLALALALRRHLESQNSASAMACIWVAKTSPRCANAKKPTLKPSKSLSARVPASASALKA